MLFFFLFKLSGSHPVLHLLTHSFPTRRSSDLFSSFRRGRLLQRFADLDLPVADINGRFEHYVWTDATLSAQDQSRLEQLLDYGVAGQAGKESKNALVLRVIPRDRKRVV